jgi:hypothetical protein
MRLAIVETPPPDVGRSLDRKDSIMAKGQQKKTKEVRKPKKEKPKSIAAAPSRGTVNDIKAR